MHAQIPKVSLSQTIRLLPTNLIADLRTDHAGETGAVWIYRGILQVTRDERLRSFAQRHIETEKRHLQAIESWLPRADHSRLLPIWCVLGLLTGAIPALLSPHAVYATIQAVETFVDRHYERQVRHLESLPDLHDLRQALLACQQDEVSHRDEAAAALSTNAPGIFLKTWCELIGIGSRAAVAVCRHV
jgi:ubiquinone biosynthesis monooxygenase Coq7